MNTFPSSIKAPVSMSVEPVKPANRRRSAAGYVMSRGAATVTKKIITAKFQSSSADRDTINTFFDANQGDRFYLGTWDPDDSTTYTVIFGQDRIRWDWIKGLVGYWSAEIVFFEV